MGGEVVVVGGHRGRGVGPVWQMRGVGREGARGWMSSSLQKRGKRVRCSAMDEASTCTKKDETG